MAKQAADASERDAQPDFLDALPRYMTAFDPALTRAAARSEWDYLWSLFRVRGMQDPGWEPYETTLRGIPAMARVHGSLTNFEEKRHLELWIYGHILEASEPYEIIANLIAISGGDSYRIERFPPKQGKRLMSPGDKIKALEEMAESAGLKGVTVPFRETWNRELRNAIFHSDYSLHGAEVRTTSPLRTYSHQEISKLVNRALALFHSLKLLITLARESYTAPVVIPVPFTFSKGAHRQAVVIVRSGYGAVGLKDNWDPREIAAGQIPFRIGKFYKDEIELLDADRTRALLPARPGEPESGNF